MALEAYLFLVVWQVILVVAMVLLVSLAVYRHVKKRTNVTRLLLVGFALFLGAMVVKAIANYFAYLDTYPDSYRVGAFLLSYFFMIVGVFFIHRFSRLVFQKEEATLAGKLVIVGAIALIVFGIIQFPIDRSGMPAAVNFLTSIDIYVVFYVLAVFLPMLVGSLKLLNRIDKDDPHRGNVLSITAMVVGFLVMIFLFVMITIYRMTTGILPNIFSYLGDFAALVTLVSAYLGFFRAKK